MSTGLAREEGSSTRSSEFEAQAVKSLFPRVAAASVVLLVVVLATRRHTGGEAWDKAAFALSVIAAALLVIRFLRTPAIAPAPLALVVSVGGIVCGITVVERPSLAAMYWEGFGKWVALLSIVLALVIIPLAAYARRSPRLSSLLATVALVLAAVDGISLVRTLRDFAMVDNNRFVLNEVLAPAAGRVPGANFVPQYTTLLGWGVLPFRHFLSAHDLANLATIGLSGLGIGAVVLAVALACRTLPERSLWLAVGVTVPLVAVTVFHNTTSSSIATLLQELPIRMFPAMLYSIIAVESLVVLLRHEIRRTLLIALGLLGGLVAWNSQDFGIAVVVTYGAVLQIATRGDVRKQASRLWITGLLPGVLIYPLWTLAIGHPLEFKYLALTARSFGGGYGSAPIQIPGPVLVVLPVLLGSASVGTYLLWKAASDAHAQTTYKQHAMVTLAFVGAWSIVSFPYYVNRSYASGQLQIFLLPFGICCCALYSLVHTATPGADEPIGPGVLAYLKCDALWLLPATLPIALGFGAVLQTPSPSITLKALRHPPAVIGFLATLPRNQVSVAVAYAAQPRGWLGRLPRSRRQLPVVVDRGAVPHVVRRPRRLPDQPGGPQPRLRVRTSQPDDMARDDARRNQDRRLENLRRLRRAARAGGLSQHRLQAPGVAVTRRSLDYGPALVISSVPAVATTVSYLISSRWSGPAPYSVATSWARERSRRTQTRSCVAAVCICFTTCRCCDASSPPG